MNRKKNGDGHTYPFRNGFRTIIKVRGISVSATGKTEAEAKEASRGSASKACSRMVTHTAIERTPVTRKGFFIGPE